MDFGTAVGRYFSNYFNFEDRARRAEYWWPIVMQILVYIIFMIPGMLLAANTTGAASASLFWSLAAGYVMFGMACFIPTLAVTVRRLHDTDKSGFWMLLGFVPFGGLVLLYFFVQSGTLGPNKYGPDPKRPLHDIF